MRRDPGIPADLRRALRPPTRVVLACVLALGGMLVTSAPAHAEDPEVTIDGITYVLDARGPDASATVSAYDPEDSPTTDIVILDEVEIDGSSRPVHGVAQEVFKDSGLTSVTFDGPISTIGKDAFSYNRWLKRVYFSGAVGTIDDWAFSSTGLTEMTFPDVVDTIGEGAFQGSHLTEVTFPGTVRSIGAEAFTMGRVAEVTFTGAVGDIGSNAFGRSRLTEVTFPDSVGDIGSGAFSENELSGVTFAGTVGDIGSGAFSENELTEVTFDGSVGNLGRATFWSNELTEVTFPDSVGDIDDSAFTSNDLTEVTFGDTAGDIGPSAFNTDRLRDVVFQGAPPTDVVPAGEDGSFGPVQAPTVWYPCAFDEALHEGGFTAPIWAGYGSEVTGAPFTVSFDLGGLGEPIDDRTVECAGSFGEPAPPSEQGWEFTGWYADEQLTEEYDFDDPVTEDITLYAGWEPVTP
ncbi:leucine-rich repeat protein [Aeromicrobium sp. CTD01-1L150]|uniref:leucine-rich repeat protein n=1 Tax=Aeromicrobium sp. CTD01-1L150 TaxID=3341830 RepID=UPI0035C10BD9